MTAKTKPKKRKALTPIQRAKHERDLAFECGELLVTQKAILTSANEAQAKECAALKEDLNRAIEVRVDDGIIRRRNERHIAILTRAVWASATVNFLAAGGFVWMVLR